MYSQDEIEDIFNKFKDYIKQSTEKEISYYLNMNAIFVQLLLHDAESQTVTLQADTAQIENMKNMQEMNAFVAQISNLALPDLKSKSSLGKLGSISNTSNLIENYETLKHDYDLLNQKIEILQSKNDMLSNENTNLNNARNNDSATIAKLREQIKTLGSGIGNKDNKTNVDMLNKLENECAEAKKKLDEQIQKYQTLVNDYDKKVSESTQFKTLKKLLQDKNTLIVQLKTKVAKYEEK